MSNTDKAILRRLAALQAVAVQQRPAVVTIHFMDGSSTTTDPGGAISLLPSGRVDSFQSNHPIYGPWAQLLTVLCHPVPNRRIGDYV